LDRSIASLARLVRILPTTGTRLPMPAKSTERCALVEKKTDEQMSVATVVTKAERERTTDDD